MQVKDAMTSDCRYLKRDDSVQAAAELMAESDFGLVPIADEERLVGMLSDRDIVTRGVAKGTDLSNCRVGELMSKKVYYCFDDQDCDDVAKNMGEMQVRRMPVINREKKLVGIVSLGDLSTRGAGESAGEALSEISRR